MPYTWDLKEMAFVSKLEFAIHLETSSWTLGNDEGERKWAGTRASHPFRDRDCRSEGGGWAWLASNVLTSHAEFPLQTELSPRLHPPRAEVAAAKPSAGQWLSRVASVLRDCGNQSCTHFCCRVQPPRLRRAQRRCVCWWQRADFVLCLLSASCNSACYTTSCITLPWSVLSRWCCQD